MNEDNCHNSIEEILDDIIIRYNKHKSVDTRINKKEVWTKRFTSILVVKS